MEMQLLKWGTNPPQCRLVKEHTMRNGIQPSVDKVMEFKGRADGLERSVTYRGGASSPERSDSYKDRDVTTYGESSGIRQWTIYKNPSDGQVSEQIKYDDGRTFTSYVGGKTVITDKNGKHEFP